MIFTSPTVRRRIRIVVAIFALFVPGAAFAGPPLICHTFEAGSAPLLPWADTPGWKAPDPAYETGQLVRDTLRLLSPDAPVLARMENMRRATIYATSSRSVAAELLAALLAKVAATPDDARAWFDAGYLVESYRQAKAIAGWDMLAGAERDGYSLVNKAIRIGGPSPDMEFAASLMTGRAVSDKHRERALAGAKPGSLLARNLGKLAP